MSWLYDPIKKSKFDYNLPIHSEEPIMPCMTWQQVIDTYVANYGHEISKEKLRKHIMEQMKMLETDLWETLELVEDNIIKEVQNDL